MAKKETGNESRFDAFFGAAKQKQAEPAAEIRAVEETGSNAIEQPLAKHRNPNVQRTTLYLPKTLHRKFKAAAVKEDREMSEIMEELIQRWLESRHLDV